ncbi:allatostatin double C [Lycorma delicatula]|uniref:allatostatin double C n=1 Tax=Lycorma delicatula TaxID=130591 RepID=UPI003F517888
MAPICFDGPCWLCLLVLIIYASLRNNAGCEATTHSSIRNNDNNNNQHVPRQPLTLIKKTAYNPAGQIDYPDYNGVKYDEYPIVVPKRAALLLDRIMVALQKAVDDETSMPGSNINSVAHEDTMDLQRRGNQKNGRIYWRCYFNAVTCF